MKHCLTILFVFSASFAWATTFSIDTSHYLKASDSLPGHYTTVLSAKDMDMHTGPYFLQARANVAADKKVNKKDNTPIVKSVFDKSFDEVRDQHVTGKQRSCLERQRLEMQKILSRKDLRDLIRRLSVNQWLVELRDDGTDRTVQHEDGLWYSENIARESEALKIEPAVRLGDFANDDSKRYFSVEATIDRANKCEIVSAQEVHAKMVDVIEELRKSFAPNNLEPWTPSAGPAPLPVTVENEE